MAEEQGFWDKIGNSFVNIIDKGVNYVLTPDPVIEETPTTTTTTTNYNDLTKNLIYGAVALTVVVLGYNMIKKVI